MLCGLTNHILFTRLKGALLLPSLTGALMPSAADKGAYSLWVTIPRTEEVYEKHLGIGKSAYRTLFVLQVHCKGGGALTNPGSAGSTQTWQLKKRYGYFERVHKLAAKFSSATRDAPPPLPRRKMLGHRDPKYLATLREELQAYLERVIELLQRTGEGMGVEDILQNLELPMATESGTWEQRTRFGGPADGRAQPVALEGFLRKQGGSKHHKEKAWRERWFVLTGSSLHYYAHQNAAAPKGAVELADAWIGEDSAESSAAAYCILLRLADGREVRLAAASVSLRSEWVGTLARADHAGRKIRAPQKWAFAI